MGNGSDSKLAFSTVFPPEWIERFGVAYLPESVDAGRRIHDVIAFLRFPPDSRLGKLLSGDVLEQVEKGSNVEAGTFELGGKKGDFRLVRIDFSGNRRSELDGTYIVHFDNETLVIVLYGYDDDRDRFKSAIKSITDNFRIEPVAVGGTGPVPGVASPEPGRTYVGLTSKESAQPFSFKFPDGWNQQGMSATPLRAEADDSSDTLGLGISEVPESIMSEQLFRGTQLLANFYNHVHVSRNVERKPVQVNDLSGVSIIAEGESPAKFSHRKLIFYVLRKGSMLLTFQGDFDAAKFDASRPQFEQFVNSFRFENPATAEDVAAAPVSAPAGAGVAPSGAAGHAVPVPGTTDASKPVDASAPTGPAASKAADASTPTGPATPKVADASAPTGAAASKPVDRSAPTTGPAAAAAKPAAQPTGVAGADGAVAAPLKAGRVDLEFPEGVTGSIEFPAGFQHTGKAPEASTSPAGGVGAVGAAGGARHDQNRGQEARPRGGL